MTSIYTYNEYNYLKQIKGNNSDITCSKLETVTKVQPGTTAS